MIAWNFQRIVGTCQFRVPWFGYPCGYSSLTVNLIVNHINSTPREILSGRTPYEVALETLGEDILKAFQLKPIEPDKVNLTPKLIRFNH